MISGTYSSHETMHHNRKMKFNVELTPKQSIWGSSTNWNKQTNKKKLKQNIHIQKYWNILIENAQTKYFAIFKHNFFLTFHPVKNVENAALSQWGQKKVKRLKLLVECKFQFSLSCTYVIEKVDWERLYFLSWNTTGRTFNEIYM